MVKQVIVMRKDLNMRRGKQIAQACHASMKVLLDRQITTVNGGCERVYEITQDMSEWLDGSFTKICVYANSEEELDILYAKTQELNIPCAMIVDAGKTEFNGVPTKTCIAVGPANSEIINQVTGHLKLL